MLSRGLRLVAFRGNGKFELEGGKFFVARLASIGREVLWQHVGITARHVFCLDEIYRIARAEACGNVDPAETAVDPDFLDLVAFAAGIVLAVQAERIALVGIVGAALQSGVAAVFLIFQAVDLAEKNAGAAVLVGIEDVLGLRGIVPVAGLGPCKIVREHALGRFRRALAVAFPVVEHVPVGGDDGADVIGALHAAFNLEGRRPARGRECGR